MTDNPNNAQPLSAQVKPISQTDRTKLSADTTAMKSEPANPPMKSDTVVEPQIKKVDISIAGVTYSVYCPINEEEELRSTVYDINNFALELKKGSPNLSQENLLVLCCLNLHEKIDDYKKADTDRHTQEKQNEALLSKIIREAQTL